jgi:hypothetical protein
MNAGNESHKHHERVAIILKKGVDWCPLEWKPINSRVMIVRLKDKHINITLIQYYASINESSDVDKDYF